MSKTLLAFAALLLLTGGAAAQTGSVEVKNAWARATAGKADDGAAYLTLESPTPDRLTGASTPAAQKAELNTMTMEGGVMKMRPLAGIDLPAGQPVTLKPGAMHVMLFGLTEPLIAGQSFQLTLSFEKAGKRKATVNVEKTGAVEPEKAAGDGMQMPMPIPVGR